MSEDNNYDDGFRDGEEAGYREHRSTVLMMIMILCYLITAFGTFAWVHETSDTYNKEFPSALAGAVWPIYWSGRGALAIVRATRGPVKSAPPIICYYPTSNLAPQMPPCPP